MEQGPPLPGPARRRAQRHAAASRRARSPSAPRDDGFAALYTQPARARARDGGDRRRGARPRAARRRPPRGGATSATGRAATRRSSTRDEPEAWAAFGAAGEDFRFPGGESLAEQQERVIAALVDITQAGELPALVVCHRGVIRCALAHTHDRGLDTYHEWTVPNGELIRL